MSFSGGKISVAISTADIDSDGALDLVVVNQSTNSLSNLGSSSTTLFGADAGDRSGWSVSDVGDINWDGFDDLVIAAYKADAASNGKVDAGESYVVFGGSTLPATIDRANFITQGLTLFGVDRIDRSGSAVSTAGDINGDSFDDLIIGSPLADGVGNREQYAGDTRMKRRHAGPCKTAKSVLRRRLKIGSSTISR